MVKNILLCFLLIFGGGKLTAQSYKALITEGLEAVQNNKLTDAERIFKKALKLDPSNVRNGMIFSNLGTVQRRLGKRDEAIESYSLAINLLPYSVSSRLDRASLYMEKNLLDKAYIDYCNVIDLDRTNEEALLYRAYIYMQQRKYNEARADYDLLLQENPKHKSARLGLALLLQKEARYKEALDEYATLMTNYPDDASILKARVYLEMEMQAIDLAMLDLETLQMLVPEDAEIYVMRGDILLLQEKKKEARTAFEKAIRLGFPRPNLHYRIKACK